MELDLRYLDVERLHCEAVVLADSVVERLNPKNAVVFDIETGPLPMEQLVEALPPFPELQPFDENEVKLGNLKDQRKIAEKIAFARESHVLNWQRKKAETERDFFEKAALDPMCGQVLAIGYGDHDGQRIVHAACEQDLLTELWAVFYAVARSGGQLIGWNSHRFDLPFCRKRSFYHGLPTPPELLKRGRYWSECCIDLMVEWTGGEFGAFAGLDRVARFLGCGMKSGDGADFSRLWEENRDEAIAYLTCDINLTVAVAQRLGF